MEPVYQEYVDNLALTETSAYGQCEYVCRKMLQTFPELHLIRGHYWDDMWGKRQHWWLITSPHGMIIDPTAVQFPSRGYGPYQPWVDGDPEPTGKSPHCGEFCYNNESVQ